MHTTRLVVRLTPRASRDVIVGEREGIVLVRVSAPPVDGAANEALIRLLAKQLHLAKGSVRIVSGEHLARRRLRLKDSTRLGFVRGWASASLRAPS